MNTRQKLTLGIAAIFMVTLTIVGITYAYFVTQVGGEGTTAVDVTTATFGEITFVKDQASVTLDSMAEDESVTLNFSVASESDSELSYDLLLVPADSGTTFLKSMTTVDNALVRDEDCYNLKDNAEVPAACYTGSHYDNVSVIVTRYTDSERLSVDTKTENGDGVIYSGNLKVLSATDNDIVKNISIAGGATHYYTLTVTHDNALMNQNAEQGAKLTITPDIASIG